MFLQPDDDDYHQLLERYLERLAGNVESNRQ